MRDSYSLLTKLFFVLLVGALLFSCDKEDTQPKLDITLLQGKQWQLTKIMVNEKGQDFEDPLAPCQEDDAIEFKADKIFVRYNGQVKCSQEADSETSQWSSSQEPRMLEFEGIEYQIIELSRSSLHLQSELQGVSEKVIVNYYYTLR